ncbi:BA14K family protein [Shinella sp. PSBB067]|uniref:BA14K family protein n=1 Tax=unclassified Shinella TaxID=2643062 RepID=UPI00193BFF18|nr:MULTISPECIES: BA14K family protein [unclassified Shinella]MBN8868241.1 BA14K family protein [Solirubrobacterales bacterium]MBN9055112.1 BA14K family protein [Hyphomicrobiales bacterium]QRI65093.1 BA14K family protein [Shinella sp. PSBB067]
MLKLKSGLAAGALSFALALTSIVPAQAITFPQVPVPAASSVEKVQYRYDRRERRAERHWHGHRGYRYQRPGYRRHSDGWWYPLAAFGLGAAIGGAINSQPRAGNAHVNWCVNRYRSYRAYDNTFQPNNGPRKQCLSPYSR